MLPSLTYTLPVPRGRSPEPHPESLGSRARASQKENSPTKGEMPAARALTTFLELPTLHRRLGPRPADPTGPAVPEQPPNRHAGFVRRFSISAKFHSMGNHKNRLSDIMPFRTDPQRRRFQASLPCRLSIQGRVQDLAAGNRPRRAFFHGSPRIPWKHAGGLPGTSSVAPQLPAASGTPI